MHVKKMEENETDVDVIELLYDVVNARKIYSSAIQWVLHKYNRLWIKHLGNAEQNNTIENAITVPEVAVTTKDIKLDCSNKKKVSTELKNKFKEQSYIMEMLNKKSKCPISQKMDQL